MAWPRWRTALPPAAIGAVVAGLAALPVQAQQLTTPPSPIERCLTLIDAAADSDTQPAYPMRAFQQGVDGRVKVELVFTLPDREPVLKMLASESADKREQHKVEAEEFEQAVRDFARRYRLPCLTPAEAPARLAIEYLFRRDSPFVVHGQPQDLARAERDALLRCVRHTSGKAQPAYPRVSLQSGTQGRVYVEMLFTAADQPPTAKVFARDSARGLATAITDWVAGLRMPCQTGEPFALATTYVFVLDRNAFGFKPGIGLSQLLGAMPPEVRQRMPRDTTAMGCPFDIRMHYTQPLRPNSGQVTGGWWPARAPFIEWLQTVVLALPEESLDSVFADHVDFTVPCLKIEPTP